MTLLEHFRRQFEYEFWANAEVLRVLAALPEPPSASTRLFAHVVAAQHLWLSRLQNRQPTLPVWPDLALEECGTKLRESRAGWQSYLTALTGSDLSDECTYTNSKGEIWTNNVADILSHIVLHSSYHRGQIALETRRGENSPAYTDYIHAVRQGFIE